MKTKTLFDHIKQVTNVQNQLYWDNITDADKKTWSNYMVHRFLSMKAEWIEVVNEIQPFTTSIHSAFIDKNLWTI